MSNFMNNAKMGLNASASALAASANNIANAQTVGYKAESAEFSSIYAGSSKEAGSGVMVSSIERDFNAGSFIVTSRDTDLAVTGKGFFSVLNESTGQIEYTRNGGFEFDKNGKLINGGQNAVLGFPAGQTSGTPKPIILDKTPLKPEVTDNVALDLNLGHVDGQDKVATTVRIYDSLGVPHDLNLVFNGEKPNTPAAGETTWDVTAEIDGTDVTASLSAKEITFNADGTIKTGSLDVDLSAQLSSYGVNNVKIDLASSTNFAGEMKVRDIDSNGQAAGEFAAVEVTDDGIVTAKYTNGKVVDMGMVALASFESVEGLLPGGSGNFVATKEAGSVVYGTSGTSGFGRIASGGLEGSNVNSSNELVDMINFQRDYQASANVLKTGKELDRAILNL